MLRSDLVAKSRCSALTWHPLPRDCSTRGVPREGTGDNRYQGCAQAALQPQPQPPGAPHQNASRYGKHCHSTSDLSLIKVPNKSPARLSCNKNCCDRSLLLTALEEKQQKQTVCAPLMGLGWYRAVPALARIATCGLRRYSQHSVLSSPYSWIPKVLKKCTEKSLFPLYQTLPRSGAKKAGWANTEYKNWLRETFSWYMGKK